MFSWSDKLNRLTSTIFLNTQQIILSVQKSTRISSASLKIICMGKLPTNSSASKQKCIHLKLPHQKRKQPKAHPPASCRRSSLTNIVCLVWNVKLLHVKNKLELPNPDVICRQTLLASVLENKWNWVGAFKRCQHVLPQWKGYSRQDLVNIGIRSCTYGHYEIQKNWKKNVCEWKNHGKWVSEKIFWFLAECERREFLRKIVEERIENLCMEERIVSEWIRDVWSKEKLWMREWKRSYVRVNDGQNYVRKKDLGVNERNVCVNERRNVWRCAYYSALHQPETRIKKEEGVPFIGGFP